MTSRPVLVSPDYLPFTPATTPEWGAAFDAVAGGMMVVDSAGYITQCNSRGAELAGRTSPSELIGREFHEVVLHEPVSASERSPVVQALERGLVARASCRAANGRVFEIAAAPHPGGAGGAVVTFDDVTLNQALSARYRHVVETVTDAIVITDHARCIVFANPAAEELFGRCGKLVGLPVSEIVPPEARSAVAEREQHALAGVPQQYESTIVRADGGQRVVSITTAPLREAGEITGIVASLRDVTEEKRLAFQLLQQEKLVAIGQLVSGVAHELNNPLAAIMAFSQLLISSSHIPPDDRSAAETIEREAKRAARIVASLLVFARQREPARELTDVNGLLDDVVRMRRDALQTPGTDITFEADDTAPATWADAGQLHQLFVILLTNAEHALAAWPGERRIIVTSSRRTNRIVVEVRDTGPGIEAANAARIFNPFFTTKPVGKGIGLGLSIADGIVREHEGTIRVESVPGSGATFIVELPIVKPGPRIGEQAVPARGSGTSRESTVRGVNGAPIQ